MKTSNSTKLVRKLMVRPEQWVEILGVIRGRVTSVQLPFPPGRPYTTVSVRTGCSSEILQTLTREWKRNEIKYNRHNGVMTVPIEYVKVLDDFNYVTKR